MLVQILTAAPRRVLQGEKSPLRDRTRNQTVIQHDKLPEILDLIYKEAVGRIIEEVLIRLQSSLKYIGDGSTAYFRG
jgi:hypothetical protein